MIRRLQALNYRCLRYADVDLGRFHVLVGPNASGKSARVGVVERADDRHAYLRLRYKSGVEIPSWMASDGTLRLLALTLPAYLPASDEIYLLEEPENGIHPLAIDCVFESLNSVYESQVLLATHSPVVLKMAELDEALCFAKDADGATDIVPGNLHPRLKDWRGSPTWMSCSPPASLDERHRFQGYVRARCRPGVEERP